MTECSHHRPRVYPVAREPDHSQCRRREWGPHFPHGLQGAAGGPKQCGDGLLDARAQWTGEHPGPGHKYHWDRCPPAASLCSSHGAPTESVCRTLAGREDQSVGHRWPRWRAARTGESAAEPAGADGPDGCGREGRARAPEAQKRSKNGSCRPRHKHEGSGRLNVRGG